MKRIIILTLAMSLFGSCGSRHQNGNIRSNIALDTMVNNRTFEIVSTWAEPQATIAMQQLANSGLLPQGSTAGNIDISTNSNYLRMKNDTVKAFLPFFGERQFGGGYNNNEDIEFEGVPKDLQIEKSKKASYKISFNIKDKNSTSESYQVYIQLFSNMSSSININSTQRNNILYRGKVDELHMEE